MVERHGDGGGGITPSGSLGTISDGSGVIQVTIAAAAGDKLLIDGRLMCGGTGAIKTTLAVAGVNVRSSTDGIRSVTLSAGSEMAPHWLYTVQSGDISGGNVTVQYWVQALSGSPSIENSSFGVPVLTVTNCGSNPVGATGATGPTGDTGADGSGVTLTAIRHGDRTGDYSGMTGGYAPISDGIGDLEVTIPAQEGDRLLVVFEGSAYGNGNAAAWCGAFFYNGVNGLDGTGGNEGLQVFYAPTGSRNQGTMTEIRTVEAGDISGGSVTVSPRFKVLANSPVYSNQDFANPVVEVVNLGGASGGSAIVHATKVTDGTGDISVPGVYSAMDPFSDGNGVFEIDIAAKPGDVLRLDFHCGFATASASGGVRCSFRVAGNDILGADGLLTHHTGGDQTSVMMHYYYTVEAADIVGGTVNIQPILGDFGSGATLIINQDWSRAVVSAINFGGGGSPFDVPATSALSVDVPAGGADDYEFGGATSSLPSGWSWFNQGGASYLEGGGWGAITVPDGGASMRGLVRAVPAGSSWDATFKLSPSHRSPAAADIQFYGITLRNSSNSDHYMMRMGSQSGIILTTATDDNFGGAANTTGGVVCTDGLGYFRIRKNSATDYDFLFSANGAVWTVIASAVNVTTHVTPDQIGFFMANDLGFDCGVACDWYRAS